MNLTNKNNNNPQNRARNPFLYLFFFFVFICILILSVIFFLIIRERETNLNHYYIQDKANNILMDFQKQVQNQEELALKLSINPSYAPTGSSKNTKFNDIILLQDFNKHYYSSVLTNDVFLYYEDNYFVYHVNKNTVLLNVYLKSLPESEKDLS